MQTDCKKYKLHTAQHKRRVCEMTCSQASRKQTHEFMTNDVNLSLTIFSFSFLNPCL